MSPWRGWFNLQRLLKMGNRVTHVSLFQKSVAKVVLSIRVVGLDFQRRLVLRNRFIQPALLGKDVAEIVVRMCIAWLDFQRLLVIG